MENSNNLSLPYIAPSQAQKHVTHNEAIRQLDTIVMLSIKSKTNSIAPNEPDEGDRYIISDTPQGEWIDKLDNIATWVDGAWTFITPKEGWLCWNETTKKIIVFSNANWEDYKNPPTQLEQITSIGVNTNIDANNRVSVSANSTLLSHEGNGHKLVINKQSSSDTASILFQNNYSGRAEFGLSGTDDFSVKVSGDGSNFTEALKINNINAEINLPASSNVVMGNYKGPRDTFSKLFIAGSNPGIRMEIQRGWGGFAAELFSMKAHKSSTGENFDVAKIGFLGNLTSNNTVIGDADIISYLYFGAGKDASHTNNGLRIFPNNNVWCAENVSAASFTDRTPYPKSLELAYECVQSIQRLPDGVYDSNDKDQQLDHKKLHPYLATTYEDIEIAEPDEKIRDAENIGAQTIVTKIARDLSATVSVQNEVIKDLILRIANLENV